MDAPKTSLSAGDLVRSVLLEDEAVTAITRKIFPLATDTAVLPYVLYRRTALDAVPTKAGESSDTVRLEIVCYAADYDQSLRLAEAVRGALDYYNLHDESMAISGMRLVDSSEEWASDAYAQILEFELNVKKQRK